MGCLNSFWSLSTVLFLLCLMSNVSVALDCELNNADPNKVWKTIYVDKSGHGQFTTVQAAIDSISAPNTKWIKIQVASGSYREKVTIPVDKPCIYLEGSGNRETQIEWGDHDQTDTSATFTVFYDNFVAKNIVFKNTYMIPGRNAGTKMRPSLAVRLYGDKYAFYNCNFVGAQDTLWDALGRHYFKDCYIEGAVDFIFGQGQSIYENCYLNMTIGLYVQANYTSYITANGRNSTMDPGGFVFKGCHVSGTGKAYLGRAWKPYSRVIFYQTQLSDIIVPAGWDAWHGAGNEKDITYAEAGNTGPGADTSQRVPWLKKASEAALNRFVNLKWINQDGWMSKLPAGLYV